MLASIIVVTHGQREVTERCLRSLRAALGDRLKRSWQLVLVDNASPDDTPELLRSWSDLATVRLLDENRNFAGGCNAGAEIATGQVLVFLNNDTEVPAGALEALVEQALEPGVGVAGSRLLFPDGTLQHAGVAFIDHPQLRAPMPQHVFHHQDGQLPAACGSYELDCVTAACMAVRADTFRAVGGFDTAFRNGLEDVDLCLKVRLRGELIVYRGDVVVIHHEGSSRGRGEELWSTPARLEAMAHNDRLLISRWSALLGQDDDLAASAWDAALDSEQPPRLTHDAGVLIVGQPYGIGPAADEARAILATLAGFGHRVATANQPASQVAARLTGRLRELLDEARRRLPGPGATAIHVPGGASDRWPLPHPSIVRLGSATTALAVDDAHEVWASSPLVADELIAAGLSPERVRTVPPPVPSVSLGPGGGGVLAVLPAHDHAEASTVMSALAQLPRAVRLRLLPTVATRGLDAHVAGCLPAAELLRPCSDELRFAELAATADAVLALDRSDVFERRALVAAAVGAAVVTARPDGPAAHVLGPRVAHDPAVLSAALAAALAEPGDRAERAASIAARCGPAAFASRAGSDRALAT